MVMTMFSNPRFNTRTGAISAGPAGGGWYPPPPSRLLASVLVAKNSALVLCSFDAFRAEPSNNTCGALL